MSLSENKANNLGRRPAHCNTAQKTILNSVNITQFSRRPLYLDRYNSNIIRMQVVKTRMRGYKGSVHLIYVSHYFPDLLGLVGSNLSSCRFLQFHQNTSSVSKHWQPNYNRPIGPILRLITFVGQLRISYQLS